MVTQKTRTAEDLIEELKSTILAKFPDSEFTVYKQDDKNYRMDVVGNFGDMLDVLDLTSERATDILIDHDIYIGVIPTPRSRL